MSAGVFRRTSKDQAILSAGASFDHGIEVETTREH